MNVLYDGRELVLSVFKSKILLLKSTEGKEIKVLMPKQMCQRSLIALAL